MCKVSIVIPIYKVEAYLPECLESIRRQTVEDIEVLMVDDGSPDESADICRSFSERDTRFRLIQQENGGVTAARRTGVSLATGEYVVFVDGDDTLPADSLEILLNHMTDEVDMVVAQPDWNPMAVERRMVSVDEYRRMLIEGSLYLAMWAKLYRRHLFNDFTFAMPREIRAGEDWIANLRLAFNTEKNVLLVPDVVYHYRQNEEGVSSTIRRTVHHEKMVFEGLCASVPAALRGEYISLICAAYAPICVRYTKQMISLSPEAESFIQEIRRGISSQLWSMLRIQDRLFIAHTGRISRLVLKFLSKVNQKLHSIIARFRQKGGF